MTVLEMVGRTFDEVFPVEEETLSLEEIIWEEEISELEKQEEDFYHCA